MKRSDLLNVLNELLGDRDVINEPLKENDHIFNDLGMDSLDTIELIMDCEHEFGIAIEDNEVEHITTIEEILDYLEENIK
jgi:acyl carrier protein